MEIDELFCKRYPEYSVNGKPLSPYFDVFEEGYEQAEKEYEEQIEHLREERNYFQEKCEDIELNYYCDHKGGCKVQELEKENAELKHNKKTVAHLADCLEEKMKERIADLEQQIEKMKCCANCKWNNLETKLVHPPCKDCNWDLDKWEIEK